MFDYGFNAVVTMVVKDILMETGAVVSRRKVERCLREWMERRGTRVVYPKDIESVKRYTQKRLKKFIKGQLHEDLREVDLMVWTSLTLMEENEKEIHGMGYTKHNYEDEAIRRLAGMVTSQAVKDYITDYKKQRMIFHRTHEEAVKSLAPEYKKFFYESPFAQLAFGDTDGEDIYLTLLSHVKREVSI